MLSRRMRAKPLLAALAVAAGVGLLVGLVYWFESPPTPAPVATVEHPMAVPPPAHVVPPVPDGGFRPHPDRVGLPRSAPPIQ